ncbi:MAG: hypothetical protein GTO14_06285 [Anaerolineales bacterium]|nr:hypothetical protein [Anaerolineales bacterium]
MKVPKRKKPLASRGHVFYLLLGLLLIIAPCIYFTVEGGAQIIGYLLCSPVMIGGLVITIVALKSLFWEQSDLQKFQRSAASSPGTIVRRYIKSPEDEYDPPSGYTIVFEFKADLPSSESQRRMLEAEVSPSLYHRLEPGSEVVVHYAGEDPQIAYLEGEDIG